MQDISYQKKRIPLYMGTELRLFVLKLWERVGYEIVR